jgi:hypothetical protein
MRSLHSSRTGSYLRKQEVKDKQRTDNELGYSRLLGTHRVRHFQIQNFCCVDVRLQHGRSNQEITTGGIGPRITFAQQQSRARMPAVIQMRQTLLKGMFQGRREVCAAYHAAFDPLAFQSSTIRQRTDISRSRADHVTCFLLLKRMRDPARNPRDSKDRGKGLAGQTYGIE